MQAGYRIRNVLVIVLQRWNSSQANADGCRPALDRNGQRGIENLLAVKRRTGATISILAALPAICLLLITLGGAAGCSITQANLTESPAVTSDPAVARILVASCYHCHSSEGANQWYAKLQPSRWFGDPALAELNFSDWGTYDAQRRRDAIRQVAAAVDSGAMPPASYLMFHSQARLSQEQKAAIARWAAAEGAAPAH